ncbi:MAG: arginase family protein [Phycisphaerales bacterium]|nr:arginase family protein [Phycisphaerales bacterium]
MPRTVLPDPRVSPRFAGIATFCRYPRLEDVAPENRPVDWAIYGVPFDAGVTYRPGARFGPRAIREASQYIKRFHIEHSVDVCDLLSLADAGDAPVRPYDCKENIDAVIDWTVKLDGTAPASERRATNHTKLFAIGGDHSIAYANIAATWERRGRPAGGLSVVHFDSHLDTVDAVWGERWGHASPFIRAIESGFIDPKAMISIGVKGPLNTRDDLEFAKRSGVTIITYEQWRADGPGAFIDFVRKLGGRETYLTFDIDVVDPAYAPGTGTPSVGGFTSAEVLGLLRSLRGINLAGADVVEVLPDRDPAGITAFLAAHILFEVLALDAARRSLR